MLTGYFIMLVCESFEEINFSTWRRVLSLVNLDSYFYFRFAKFKIILTNLTDTFFILLCRHVNKYTHLIIGMMNGKSFKSTTFLLSCNHLSRY